ncbi:MAG: hypothetical protein KJO04_04990 [Bacteroidia bacterium]|nr:hypothetical protein [Bacteroidia bacterium]
MKDFLKTTLLLLAILLLVGCSKDPEIDPKIYLDTNDVTIKCDVTGTVADTFTVKGITYTIVDEAMLRKMVSQGADVTTMSTSRVTDMHGLISADLFNEIEN